MTELRPGQIFAGRRLFLLGGTGFLGKVCLSMLLDRFPQLGRVYLMVRASSQAESESRFWDSLVPSPAFDPLRERYGKELRNFLAEKVVIVGGDITLANLGQGTEQASEIAADIDLLLNCSGRVTFNPPLEAALKTNVTGTLNTIAFAKRMKRPALVHVSTCFVAGNRSGEIWENEPLKGYFPRRLEDKAHDFRVDREIDDSGRLAARVRDESRDKSLADRFRERAKKRFLEEGRNPDDEKAMSLAITRERKNWIRTRLTDLGIDKAQGWGWPNIYTYTKSLGEQLVAGEEGLVRAIVRPAIVESALEFPFPGWNEGFTTTAPLVRMALRGQNLFPVKTDVILDVIPVDMVASAVLAVTAQAMVAETALVYQVSSGDQNPARLGRLVDLLGLYKRKHFLEKSSGSALLNDLAARMEAQTVSPEGFEKYSLPAIHKAARQVTKLLDKVSTRQFGPLAPIADQLKEAVENFDRFAREGEEHYKTFRPFIVDNNYIFRTDNTRALFSQFPEEDQKLLSFRPETIDWYDYWLNVHLPGLQKWVFPRLEETDKPKSKRVYTYRTLLELFEACTKNHAGRLAMRMERDEREERYTYSDFRECVLRAAAFLSGKSIKLGDRVALLSENAPEWGMCYFGILRAGATVIPLEKEISTSGIAKLLRLGEASALIVSPSLRLKHKGLRKALKEVDRDVRVWKTNEVFRLGSEAAEQASIDELGNNIAPGHIASIIFTSGTTGNPKGVMLTHRNFASLLGKLHAVYDLDNTDGMLSVLPLHHSFEFMTGFLLPLSRGAQITYLEEMNGDTVSRALEKGHVTCIVGVPALWDLLKRRVLNRFSERSALLEDLVTALCDANYLLRDETPFNFGPLLFLPVHLAFGGRIRYLISGGSALSESTLKTFRGLGFNLNEGYGLTEAAPVLTVTRPEEPNVRGSVGRALPGVEIRIDQPDSRGVGEVLAKGANVMKGYFRNERATEEALDNGWLRTGDLGRLDEEGNLFIVGRLKEIIVDSNGKNVYPDELEEIYVNDELIEEFAVVGIRDGVGERVAAVVVPKDGTESKEAIETRVLDHFHRVSATLPLYKRVKTIQLRDDELPRTATRKVKRRELVRWLEELRERQSLEPGREGADSSGWLRQMIATICEKPVSNVHLDSRLEELGFDSLMYAELSSAIESRTGEAPSPEVLTNLSDIRELAEILRWRQVKETSEEALPQEEGEIRVPAIVVHAGRLGLSAAQRWFYHDYMSSDLRGQTHVPKQTHFLVAANHASHLDMGLVKMALGEAGENLVALAAADYFFDNKVKRAFFENFTNLVPMERKGSLRKTLEWAFQLLDRGYNVLIFPEGTRSRTGEIQPFQRGIGHLALRAKVGVLPVFLSTHRALPPGTWYPQNRELSATVGPFLDPELLQRLSEGLPRSKAERAVSALIQRVVEHLRDEVTIDLDNEVELQRSRFPTVRSARTAAALTGVSKAGPLEDG